MEILGIGPSELLLIVLIAIIVLGPKDMQKAGLTIGRWLKRVVTSDGWKLFQQTSREIQTLPNRLMREAALEELKDVQKDLRHPLDAAARGAAGPAGAASGDASIPPPGAQIEPKILPGPPAPPHQAADQDKSA